jgi:serine/threonine-protein phosphatase 2B catalytic subunit
VEVYDLFMEIFDAMPIACNISRKYLAMHGGISPGLKQLDQINEIDRKQEIPLDGIFCDLMWADPMDDEEAVNGDFKENPERDCSNYFGKKPVKQLLRKNRLLSIFRGHQVKQEGFQMHRWGAKDSFPYVITIFSAPNYCGSYKNKASVLILKNNNLQLKQYSDTEPPYQLPEGLDLFSWSLPFLAEKVTSMLYQILKQCTPGDLDNMADTEIPEELKKML